MIARPYAHANRPLSIQRKKELWTILEGVAREEPSPANRRGRKKRDRLSVDALPFYERGALLPRPPRTDVPLLTSRDDSRLNSTEGMRSPETLSEPSGHEYG